MTWSKEGLTDFEKDFDSVKRIRDTDSEVEAEGGDKLSGDYLDGSGDKLDLVIMIR